MSSRRSADSEDARFEIAWAIASRDLKLCRICRAKGMTDDNYCYGCKSFVCDDCSLNPTPSPGHEPVAHTLLDEDEDDL